MRNYQAIFYKIKILFLQEKYDEVLELLNEYETKFKNYQMFEFKVISLIKTNQIEEAVTFFVNSYNVGNIEDIFIYWFMSHELIEEKIMIKILEGFRTPVVIMRDWRLPEVYIPYVLGITEKYAEKGEIRYKLLQLYIYTNSIKNSLKVNLEEVKEIYHYSQACSLQYLPQYSENIGGSKLRLGNIAYLNDPEEGKIFYKILQEQGCDALNSIYDDNELKYENTYLASFSTKADFLPMWVQYAADGSGNCYAINTNIFSQYESKFEEQILGEITHNKFRYSGEKYILYKVYYYDFEEIDKNDSGIIDFCKKIGGIVGELKSYLQNGKINQLVKDVINSIRYLFKDCAYASEDELRVICIDYNGSRHIDITGEGVPRFYMELDKDIYFNKIILGPKAIDVKKKATYLSCCKNVGKVEQSKIQYV